VFPEAELTLELRRDETGLHFRYFDAQRTYSSGKILFDNELRSLRRRALLQPRRRRRRRGGAACARTACR
jgi:hypothetical protein